jgi:hypothetical protein
MRSFAHVALVLAVALASASGRADDPSKMPPAAAAAVDQSVTSALDTGRAGVRAHPASAYEAQVFAQQADNAFVSGTVARGKIDGAALVTEASGYIEAAMKGATPDQTVQLLTVKAVLLKDAGRVDDARAVAKQAEAAYAAAHGAKPAPAAAAAPEAPATAAAAPTVTVRITSLCAKSVSIATGATAAGAPASILPPETPWTKDLAPGDSVWLLGKNGKSIAHARVGATTKTVHVDKSCRGVVAR